MIFIWIQKFTDSPAPGGGCNPFSLSMVQLQRADVQRAVHYFSLTQTRNGARLTSHVQPNQQQSHPSSTTLIVLCLERERSVEVTEENSNFWWYTDFQFIYFFLQSLSLVLLKLCYSDNPRCNVALGNNNNVNNNRQAVLSAVIALSHIFIHIQYLCMWTEMKEFKWRVK